MELKHVLLTILKILVSTVLLIQNTDAGVLMGGHIDNKNSTNSSENDYDYTESTAEVAAQKQTTKHNSEEIPDPSPLVLPGYNLPENIFNHGKPFYVEKDPLTGKIDFDHKSPSLKSDETDYEYQDSDDIYAKKNINRKDGSYGSLHHQQTDVNQLTPNFHDFLNLPVKYNQDKYVYPLISSSYASTKIQGSVNKFHNHKDTFGVQKPTTTKKPSTTTQTYFTPRTTQRTMATTVVTTTTTTPKPTTIKRFPELTTAQVSVLNSPMSHPSFNEEYDYYDEATTTTKNTHSTMASTTTTKKVMSLFEQLFGDYDETVTTTKPTTTTTTTTTTSKPIISITTNNYYPNIHAGPQEGYEYEYSDDNVAVENNFQENLSVEPLNEDKIKPTKKPSNFKYSTTTQKPSTTTTYRSTSTTTTTTRVTSLPLGDNHIGGSLNRDPIIVATQNLREKLNSEKVNQNQLAPSSSSIHIAPNQDTVSFVVGHHQSVGDSDSTGQYVGTATKESSFRPLQVDLKPLQTGSAVTIQPLKNSEASLAIGMPVNGIKQVPGQVMDASLDNDKIHFPKAEGNKVVFPEDKQANKEVLKLNSKPMYHQLPSDLTPPKENDVVAFPSRYQDRPMRPPWDPRPGHFYSGKPEYARPPRPPPEVAFKRIDTLPNILPQFRPNMQHHYRYDQRFNRQPLLERPSNRPIGFFEKMPLYKRYPPPKNIVYRPQNYDLEERRPLAQQPPQSLEDRNLMAEDRIMNEDPRIPTDADLMYQTPPNIHIANRRTSDVETLQMIQAKNSNISDEQTTTVKAETDKKTDIYKVYPVNNNSEAKNNKADFNFEKHRNEAPILKPHSRPSTLAIKSDFPYPLERPNNNKLDDYSYNNQWNSMQQQDEKLESRIVNNNIITATLKSFTEKPIAIAYTPTEPNLNLDKYSMPNYGSPVIPEIRPGTVENVDTGYVRPNINLQFNHKVDIDIEADKPRPQQDFQAPFQASVKLDAATNQGWSVVRDKNKTTTVAEEPEATTLPMATTSEFDIENFKPQLIGGFKPIYPEVDGKDAGVAEREEK
ncbi:unnamed protein product [Ceutorhynchus assimilis]|uniref:Uncharacterized protein n=1 Tax=Ceutorhynchus assimilis TaxID=467358 RepID=A0A9N9MF31_9CUCU|nr:unnamed protein product [Ceutorhynchus assimilis]